MKVHDVCSAFFAFWDESSQLDAPAQCERFKATVAPAFPAFYDYRFQRWRERGKDPDAELARELARTPQALDGMRTVRARLDATIERDLTAFRRALPDFRDDVEVYLVHSLGECDGGVRVLQGRPTFLLGIDVIARLHEASTDTPFLHHELFHLYHMQWFEPGREAGYPERVIHTSLWMEGLATYASRLLNPAAAPRDLLLDTPHGMWTASEARRGELADRLLADLRSQDAAVYSRWFLAGDDTPDLPRRAGYHIGYRALQRIGEGQSLSQLARMTESQFVPLLAEALVALRDGRP